MSPSVRWLVPCVLMAQLAGAQSPVPLRFVDFELLGPTCVTYPGTTSCISNLTVQNAFFECFAPPTGCVTSHSGTSLVYYGGSPGLASSDFLFGCFTAPTPRVLHRSIVQGGGQSAGSYAQSTGLRTTSLVVPEQLGPAIRGFVVELQVDQGANLTAPSGHAKTYFELTPPNGAVLSQALRANPGERLARSTRILVDASVGDTIDIVTRSDSAHVNAGTPTAAYAGTIVCLIPSPAIVKVPLGGSVVSTLDPGSYRVYVPTYWGGELTLSTDRGAISKLTTPNGVEVAVPLSSPLIHEVQQGEHGWYTFDVTGTGGAAHVVATKFVQSGTATSTPWDFWYYPLVDAADPNLYDGTLAWFDSHFGLYGATQAWETTSCGSNCMRPGVAGHLSTTEPGWAGHCHGAVIASILLDQPRAAFGFQEDQLEGLAAEYFGSLTTKGIRLADPRQGELATAADTDAIDPAVHRFHQAFRSLLKDQSTPFALSLRQHDAKQMWTKVRGTFQAKPPQVWNQACYAYTAELREDPAAVGDPETETIRQIQVVNRFTTNNDYAPPSDGSLGPLRFVTEYLLLYGTSGRVLEDGVATTLGGAQVRQNWRSFQVDPPMASPEPPDRYVPWLIADVRPAATAFARSQAPGPISNPMVTADRLKWLGLSLRPEFQPPPSAPSQPRAIGPQGARPPTRWVTWRIGDRWSVRYTSQHLVPIKSSATPSPTTASTVYDYRVVSMGIDDDPGTPPTADVRMTSREGFGNWLLTFDTDELVLLRAVELDAMGAPVSVHDNPFGTQSWMLSGDPAFRGAILDFPRLSATPGSATVSPRLSGTQPFQRQIAHAGGQRRQLTARLSRSHAVTLQPSVTTIDWLEGDLWWSTASIAVGGTTVVTGTRLP